MINSQQVNSAGSRVFMGTITGNADIHQALTQFSVESQVKTATFQLLGGLTKAVFTEYNFQTQSRGMPIIFERPLEIIAGHGTISQLDAQPHVHLHLALSFQNPAAPDGISVVGGHAAQALAFAVEFTLTAYDGTPVHRAIHTETGLKLWVFQSGNP